MTRKLVLASAGAGKSKLIVDQTITRVALGEKVLILTYTMKNQEELVRKFCKLGGVVPRTVTIKGWFTFLLEDMIRPYQSCIFQDRISNINFNSVDPHKSNGINLAGRAEKYGSFFNPKHFLTIKGVKAHTTYLSKLATRINTASGGRSTSRLSEIYGAVFIDEVQDLTGWDFEIIKSVSASKIAQLCCVGDFRQTLYSTHSTTKKPKDNNEKIEHFGRIGLTLEQLNVSWRCAQVICDFSDLVHADEDVYKPTESKLKEIDPEYAAHIGVFVVRTDSVREYIDKYKPVILRSTRKSHKELCEGQEVYNFGEAKGLGFKRVLICVTDKHKKFLAGKDKVFAGDKTPKAKNALYVAITRARFSVAFLYDGELDREGVEVWPSFL